MPLPSSISDLSQTAGSNSPAGSESPALIDDYLRTYASYIAILRDALTFPVVGSARNAKMALTAASATATFSATEIVVKSALGQSWLLTNLGKTINLATTGAGAMDTGLAPVTGYVALYVIYNPLLALSSTNPAMLGVNATSAIAPETYGGSNMPSGYTASALVAVVPTDASRLMTAHVLQDRKVYTPYRTLAAPTAEQPTLKIFSTTTFPLNAKSADVLFAGLSSAAPAAMTLSLSPTPTSIGAPLIAAVNSVAGNGFSSAASVPVLTPQTLYYSCTCSAGAPTFNFGVVAYEF